MRRLYKFLYLLCCMKKENKKPKPTMDELVKKYEEFASKNEMKEITKYEFEENLKKLASKKDFPKDKKKQNP